VEGTVLRAERGNEIISTDTDSCFTGLQLDIGDFPLSESSGTPIFGDYQIFFESFFPPPGTGLSS